MVCVQGGTVTTWVAAPVDPRNTQHEMCWAPLPRGALQHGGDGALETLVVVGDDQADSRQPAGHQAAQERRPADAVLGDDDFSAEDLPMPSTLTPTATTQATLTVGPPS